MGLFQQLSDVLLFVYNALRKDIATARTSSSNCLSVNMILLSPQCLRNDCFVPSFNAFRLQKPYSLKISVFGFVQWQQRNQ
jgi:hypothetical protein